MLGANEKEAFPKGATGERRLLANLDLGDERAELIGRGTPPQRSRGRIEASTGRETKCTEVQSVAVGILELGRYRHLGAGNELSPLRWTSNRRIVPSSSSCRRARGRGERG